MEGGKGRDAAVAIVALLAGVSLLALGLREIGVQVLVSAWEPEALRRFATFAVGVAALTSGLAFLPARWSRSVGLVLGSGALLWTFGPAAVMSGLLVVGGAAGLGSWIQGEWAVEDRDRAEIFLLTFAIGLAILVCLGNSLSHFAINGPALYLAVLLPPLVAHARRFGRLLSSMLSEPVGRRSWDGWYGPVALTVVVIVHAAHAALPEMIWDALAMHLFVPTYVATFGRWSYDAARYAWAVFPMGADWLFTYAFVLGGELAAKLLNLAIGSATSGLLYLRLRRVVPAGWAGLLAAACMSAPILVLLSASLLVENAQMFLMLAGLLAVERLDRRARSWVALWCILAALCSIKLQGAIFATGLTLLALWRAARSADARPPIAAWVLAVPALVLALQPYATAYWITGNPLFPFYNAIFKSPLFPADQNFVDTRWARGWGADSVWGMTFQSGNYLETGSPGALGYLVLTLGPLALAAMVLKRTPAIGWAAAVSFFYLLVVGSSVQYVRYFSPVLPILTIAAVGMAPLSGRIVGRVVQIALIAVVLLNCLSMPSGSWLLKGFHAYRLLEADGRRQLLGELIPQRPLNEVVAELEPDPVTVAYFGNPVGAGLEGNAIYYAWYNTRFMAAVDQATTEQQIARAIGDSGAKYVIANFAEAVPHQDLLARALASGATLIRRIGWAQLFLLNPEFRLKPELLVNPGFDADAHGWFAAPTTPEVRGDGVAVMRPGMYLAQAVPVTLGERHFEGEVVLDCLSGETLVWVRLEWARPNASYSTMASERVVCGGVQRLAVPVSGDVPESPAVLQLVVHSIRGGDVGIDQVSLRAAVR